MNTGLSSSAGIDALPAPSREAEALSRDLTARIVAEIGLAGGSLPFARYMELALYAPGLGYYSNGVRKFGAEGDFVTAPETSDLFGRTLARCGAAVFEQVKDASVLEFGAGSGRLAVDLLREWEALGCLPDRYLILDRSGYLREVQKDLIDREVPHLSGRVDWIEQLPDAFSGFMLGNEVLDANPVHRFRWQDERVLEWVVRGDAGRLTGAWRESGNEGLIDTVRRFQSACALPDGYQGEVDLLLQPWVRTVAESLCSGMLLLVDYGYPRRELYHPQRAMGSLMCHYRHRAHDDPLLWPGLQDITAYVDFTSVAEAGVEAGLELAGFTTQAHFLLDCGLERMLAELPADGSPQYLSKVSEAKRLILPGEMGERFRCIGLQRGLSGTLPGFRLQDLRGRL